MRSFSRRRLEGELMDDPQLDAEAHAHALRGLRRINRVSRTLGTLWHPIERLARARPERTLSVIDVATGGGDLPIALCRKARRHGVALEIEGCDISPVAIDYARNAAARAAAPVGFFCADALASELPRHYDIITSSLFLHHLTEAQVITLLRALAANADHVLVSDLIRNWTGYGLAFVGTRALSRSPIVHIDGLRSVRAAFTLSEARDLAARAGLGGAHFSRHWPSRFLMHWQRGVSGHA